jgi:hypothetical protein
MAKPEEPLRFIPLKRSREGSLYPAVSTKSTSLYAEHPT